MFCRFLISCFVGMLLESTTSIAICAGFGFFICLRREIRFYLFGKKLIGSLSRVEMRAFHEDSDLFILNSH